jgi:hypothetical protein
MILKADLSKNWLKKRKSRCTLNLISSLYRFPRRMRVETLDGIHTQKTSMMLKMASKTLMTQVLKIMVIII